MTIGERIKFVRKKHGLTQVQLLTIVNKVASVLLHTVTKHRK